MAHGHHPVAPLNTPLFITTFKLFW